MSPPKSAGQMRLGYQTMLDPAIIRRPGSIREFHRRLREL
jgi:hypothetical protein